MYTRCPSCRAEISFEPPANMENLPDGYKHRIKCPSCGVTIGVKINKIDTQAASLVQPAPAYNQPQTNFEPLTEVPEQTAPAKEKANKHSGIGRNVIMMILSLLFIGIQVFAYLLEEGTFSIKNVNLFMDEYYMSGVGLWNLLISNSADFAQLFEGSFGVGLLSIVPMISLTLACVNFIVALVSAIGKKYGRAYNLVSSILLAACGVLILFYPFFVHNAGDPNNAWTLLDFFVDILAKQSFMLLVSAVLGVVQLVFGLAFLKSLERKDK